MRNGCPSRSRTVSSSTCSGLSTARPRRRPSRKSTFWRLNAEYGERRNAYRSVRVPPSHAKRSRLSNAWPYAVLSSRTYDSSAYGTPSVPSAVSSGACQGSSEGQTMPICSGATPPPINVSSSSPTSSSAPRGGLTRHSLRRVAPQQVAVPETEAIELTAVGGIEGGELPVEIVRIEQSRLELRDGR